MRLSVLSLVLLISTSGHLMGQENASPAAPAAPLKKTENVNAAIVAARKASAEKRFADAETMMLPVTQSEPNLILPWVELGLAQLGLKKYPEAENSFKLALGIDPASLERAHGNDFYQASSAPGTVAPTATRASRNTAGGTVTSGQDRTPEIQGVCWAGLGEIYAHEQKFDQATAAFDSAVKAYPVNAALYRHNETVMFFQASNADGQLTAATQAIALDPNKASNYYFKGQALASKATLDPQTQKMVLPAGCAEAYQKYLELEPNGQFSADAKGILTASGIPVKAGKK